MFRIADDAPTRRTTKIGIGAMAMAVALGLSLQAVSVTLASAAKRPTILVVTTKSAALGTYLRTAQGKTLYTFTLDTATKSHCSGACAAEWPPVLVPKGVKLTRLVRGVGASKLGRIRRSNGTFQLTYAGKPLYRFAGDRAAGSTKGQGFDNEWSVAVVLPAPVSAAAPATPVGAPVPPPSSTGPSTSIGSTGSHAASGGSASSGGSAPTTPAPTSQTPTSAPPTPTSAPTTQPTQPTPTQPTKPPTTQPVTGGY
jgi:predicted lipoprotein with Yx(FWY)xxD motif